MPKQKAKKSTKSKNKKKSGKKGSKKTNRKEKCKVPHYYALALRYFIGSKDRQVPLTKDSLKRFNDRHKAKFEKNPCQSKFQPVTLSGLIKIGNEAFLYRVLNQSILDEFGHKKSYEEILRDRERRLLLLDKEDQRLSDFYFGKKGIQRKKTLHGRLKTKVELALENQTPSLAKFLIHPTPISPNYTSGINPYENPVFTGKKLVNPYHNPLFVTPPPLPAGRPAYPANINPITGKPIAVATPFLPEGNTIPSGNVNPITGLPLGTQKATYPSGNLNPFTGLPVGVRSSANTNKPVSYPVSIASEQKEVQNLSNKIHHLQDKTNLAIDQFDKRTVDLSKATAQEKQELEQYQKTIAELKKTIEKDQQIHLERFQALASEKLELTKKINELEATNPNTNWDAKIQTLEKERKEARDKVSQILFEKTQLENQIIQLQNQLQGTSGNDVKTKLEIFEKDEKIKTLNIKIEGLEKTYQDWQQLQQSYLNVKSSHGDLQVLRDEIDRWVARDQQREVEVEQQIKEIKKIHEQQIQKLNTAKNQLVTEKEQLLTQIENITASNKTELDRIHKENLEYKKRNEELLTLSEQLQTTSEKLYDSSAELENAIVSLKQDKTRLIGEVALLRNIPNAPSKDYLSLQEKITQLTLKENELEQVHSAKKRLETEIGTLNTQIALYKESLTQQEESIRVLNEKNLQLGLESIQQREEIARLNTENVRLQQQGQGIINFNVANSNAQIQALQQEKGILEAQIQSLKQHNFNMDQLNAKLQSEILGLKQELSQRPNLRNKPYHKQIGKLTLLYNPIQAFMIQSAMGLASDFIDLEPQLQALSVDEFFIDRWDSFLTYWNQQRKETLEKVLTDYGAFYDSQTQEEINQFFRSPANVEQFRDLVWEWVQDEKSPPGALSTFKKIQIDQDLEKEASSIVRKDASNRKQGFNVDTVASFHRFYHQSIEKELWNRIFSGTPKVYHNFWNRYYESAKGRRHIRQLAYHAIQNAYRTS